MMVTFYLKKLLSCTSILEFDKIYGFINKVFFLCNLNNGSEKKVKHRGSIVVFRKMPETLGRHFPKPIPSTATA